MAHRQTDRRARELRLAFGQVLRQERLRAGLSQEKLALDAGYHPTYVSMLERGVQNPSLWTIFEMCEVIGVSPAKIVEQTWRGWKV